MARTIGIPLLAFLIGVLLGAVTVHQHQKNIWKQITSEKKFPLFDQNRGNGPNSGQNNNLKPDRLPPELMERIGPMLQLSEQELANRVESLPFYQNLSLEERSKFLDRITHTRKKQIELGNDKAKELDLVLDETQKNNFRKSLFEKRLKNMKLARSKSKDYFEELEKQSDDELRKEFSK